MVGEFLENSAREHPDKVALIAHKKRLTYAQVDNAANSLANALIANGIQRQDRVAIYLENSIESVVSVFGILKASGIFVIVNPQVKSKKLGYILNDCQVKILITDSKHLAEISGNAEGHPHLRGAISVDEHEDDGMLLCGYKEAMKYPNTPPPNRSIDIDLAILIYTSGSTGTPKGVMLTHLNVVSAANSIIEYLENTDKDIIMDCLPLSFDYGLYQVLMAFKFGGTVVLEKSFLYPYHIIESIIREEVTGFPIVPPIAAILLKNKNLAEYDFSRLRYITSTAQVFPVKYIVQLQKALPNVKIFSMYGLTECKRVSYLPPEELSRRPSSVGKAMPNVETYLVNERGEMITKAGEVGELVVRGSNVMKGYWNLPEESAKKLRIGLYPGETNLFTGDLFKMDEDAYLYFVARKDNMIKTAGGIVSPKEVEDALYEIDDVVEAGVLGIPDDVLGQAVKAVVALRKGSKLTKEEIMRLCTRKLERCMVPKHVEIREQLPRTPTGKIAVGVSQEHEGNE
ncbi:MAG TPA: AMP-binding protein [Methanomassiliicoccales archaeon]|nr:AMP-binding protein [Methanomassiliicoccales archaeon]